jgi:hypothetical protein
MIDARPDLIDNVFWGPVGDALKAGRQCVWEKGRRQRTAVLGFASAHDNEDVSIVLRVGRVAAFEIFSYLDSTWVAESFPWPENPRLENSQPENPQSADIAQ